MTAPQRWGGGHPAREKCRLHFQALLKRYPPDVTGRAAFTAWMGYFHDQVNVTLGKPLHRAL